jgi:hypothetical protein
MVCFLCFGLGEMTLLLGAGKKPDFRNRSGAGLAGAVFISWILLVKVKGHSLWWGVFHLVPGASAIRVVNRYQLVLYVAMCVVVAIGLQRVLEARRRSLWITWGIVAAALVLLGEQANHMQTFDKISETNRLSRVQWPPAACRVFFADYRPSMDRPFYAFQTDAAMVARATGLPTVNGYSSNFPKGWDLLFHTSPSYSSGVADWVLSHELESGLCSLDLERGSWRRLEAVAPADVRGVELVNDLPSSVAEALSRRRQVRMEGFYGREQEGRWTNGSGAISFNGPVGSRQLSLRFAVLNPRGSQIRLRINDTTVTAGDFAPGTYARDVATPELVSTISLESNTFVPRNTGLGPDDRRLGVYVSKVTLH